VKQLSAYMCTFVQKFTNKNPTACAKCTWPYCLVLQFYK